MNYINFKLNRSSDKLKIYLYDNISTALFRLLTISNYIYLSLFALCSPVTLWDSNTYNIARIEIMLRSGIFGNKTFNDPRQVFMIWTFDGKRPAEYLCINIDSP